ncbi:hypothetical protein TRV_02261, partial [Trichophyton verrucosum HKI 0517]
MRRKGTGEKKKKQEEQETSREGINLGLSVTLFTTNQKKIEQACNRQKVLYTAILSFLNQAPYEVASNCR